MENDLAVEHHARHGRCSSRLADCSPDELRVVEQLLDGLERGRAVYGMLELASDNRDWLAEARAELRDCLFYLCAYHVAEAAKADKG